MTTDEAIQRGNNLIGVAIAVLSGVAFFPEFFLETEGPRKLDEVALLLVGLIGLVWYVTGRHRLRRSAVPLVLVGVDLVIKVLGLVIEFADTEDAGDEYGAVVLFALALILLAWLYFTSRSGEQAQSQAG